MTESLIQSVHCDKLSITGNLDWHRKRQRNGEWKTDSNVLRRLFDPREIQIDSYPSKNNAFYTQTFQITTLDTSSKIFIQANTQHTATGRGFRVDFNPSKLAAAEGEWLADLLSHIEEKRVTRADIAVDFHGDFSNYRLFDGRQRSERIYIGKDGVLESVYRGAENSDTILKMYDKKKEQAKQGKEISHDWWRIEETIKSEKAYEWESYQWFDNVQLTSSLPIFPTDTAPRWKSAALTVVDKKMSMNEFEPNNRRKIKDTIAAATFAQEMNLKEELSKEYCRDMFIQALEEIRKFSKNTA